LSAWTRHVDVGHVVYPDIPVRGGRRLDLHHSDCTRRALPVLAQTGFLVALCSKHEPIETKFRAVFLEQRREFESPVARLPPLDASHLRGVGFAGTLKQVGLPQAEIPITLLFFKMPQVTWAAPLPAYVIGSLAIFWVVQRTIADRNGFQNVVDVPVRPQSRSQRVPARLPGSVPIQPGSFHAEGDPVDSCG